MEAKYYTPELSELHFGFEFEANREWGLIPDQKDEWQKTELKYNDIWFTHNWDLSKCIRVKYLDKQDIVECGWTIDNNCAPSKIASSWRFFGLRRGKQELELNIEEDNSITIKDVESFECDYFIVNSIKIKNKSELKKVMKMFGIV